MLGSQCIVAVVILTNINLLLPLLFIAFPTWQILCVCSFLKKMHSYWTVVALQCCISFCVCAQSHTTLCNPMGYSLPGSSVHGILQARILEWVAISSSRGYS